MQLKDDSYHVAIADCAGFPADQNVKWLNQKLAQAKKNYEYQVLAFHLLYRLTGESCDVYKGYN